MTTARTQQTETIAASPAGVAEIRQRLQVLGQELDQVILARLRSATTSQLHALEDARARLLGAEQFLAIADGQKRRRRRAH